MHTLILPQASEKRRKKKKKKRLAFEKKNLKTQKVETETRHSNVQIFCKPAFHNC